MEKLKMRSKDFTDENIEKLAALFPNCVAESRDEKGAVKRSIDFDQLRQELSGNIVDGPQERYQLNWPGKKEALLAANAPIAKTLRPCREESVDFDTTKNLFIEGDNLDALKLLQETYLGKVKMIYIDPPYNTGKDFIYKDNFAQSKNSFLQNSLQMDAQRNQLVTNTDANGRFHSDWLNMMYPRIKLARNLLKDDGVIFVSIDDSEMQNLRKVCDEIFGGENFIGNFVWMSKKGGGSDNNGVVTEHEYVFCYGKTIGENCISRIEIEAEPLDKLDEHGPYRRGRELNKWGANSRREDRPTMFFPIPGPDGQEVYPIRNDGEEGCWRWGKPKMLAAAANSNIDFVVRSDGTFVAYEKIRHESSRNKPHRTYIRECGATADGTKLIKMLFEEKKVFDFPKPLELIATLVEIGSTASTDIILDFFTGSATTAQAVMEMNVGDGGSRKFIMIQLAEACDKKTEAFKEGFKTIADISKERILRAGKKIQEKNANSAAGIDIGFRVLKIDSSNMADVFYSPDSLQQDLLKDVESNLKADRTAEDLLFQVLLDWGVDLSLPITRESIEGKEVFFVDTNALAACFEGGGKITESFCKELAKRAPLRVVFRDAGFANDAMKINVEQIFKLLSPHTEVRTL